MSDTRVTVEFYREVDGRWLADIPQEPGCMAYGATKDEARAAAIALLNAARNMSDKH